MITARAAGDAALLVEAGPQAGALAAAVRAARLPGVTDVVTGAVTVLLVTEPGRDLVALAKAVGGLDVPDQPPPAGELVVPVVYDGPDLAEVARLAGLTEEQVTERHAASEYTVGWLGFSPGFGYLTGLDPALHVPRLATPRTRVPAGSVAIAGPLAAVYPTASPGGWRLIGRTSVRLWDTGREPPAVFSAGQRVTFRPVSELPPADFPAGAGGARRGRRPGRLRWPRAARWSRWCVLGRWRPCRTWAGRVTGTWGCPGRGRPTRGASCAPTSWRGTRRGRRGSS